MTNVCNKCGFEQAPATTHCPRCGAAQHAPSSPATVAMTLPFPQSTSPPAPDSTNGDAPSRADVDETVTMTADDLAAIDMRQALDGQLVGPVGPTRRPLGTPSGAFAPPDSLDQTDLEGLEPVRLSRGRRVISVEGHRRQAVNRAGPVLLVGLLALTGWALAGYQILTADSMPAAIAAPTADIVELAGGTYVIGLTEENKDNVLQGCFRLSDNPNYDCRRDHLRELGEYPARQVAFPSFAIDRTEVPNRAYEACANAGACPPRALHECQYHTHQGYQLNATVPARMLVPDAPAICVTRDQAEAFCAWSGGRLPTPDEWERAARGGDDRLSPWGELWSPNVMNWAETDMGGFPVTGRLDGYDLTAPVTQFSDGATPDHLLNMFGNAAEWVAPVTDREDGIRGGSYRDDLRDFRITMQTPLLADALRSYVGFRCVYER